jgi:inner membrane protein
VPSPLGHVLGGVAAGWLVAGRAKTGLLTERSHQSGAARDREGGAALFALIGAAPDLDLLFGTHSTYTHSLGAIALTALAALAWTRGRQPRLALACAAAVASHVLLDWMGSDTTPPIGIMALWPFTREFYQSPLFVFMAISRRWWLPGFYIHNGLAALREIAILLPIVTVIGILRVRSTRTAGLHPGSNSAIRTPP